MNVGIIGCGLIGNKRAKALCGCSLVMCADTDLKRAELLAKTAPSCVATSSWQDVIHRNDVDIIIVATTHVMLSQIILAAVLAGKHVLVEKPAAKRPGELDAVIRAARENNRLVHVGFNHRYHRAFLKAKALVTQGELGELMFIRARYGHGGRIGYDKEWRAIPELSGGGELIDQGMHLIDLSRWFLGDFVSIEGFAHTFYWDMPVDDNGFMLLKTAKNQVAFLHASCSEWKNLFSFEIYGKKGKLDISGLGGSYGVERLAFYRMLPEMGPPETMIWEYPMGDNSWEVEFQEFLEDIQLNRQPSANLVDAQAALTVVETIYKESYA